MEVIQVLSSRFSTQRKTGNFLRTQGLIWGLHEAPYMIYVNQGANFHTQSNQLH